MDQSGDPRPKTRSGERPRVDSERLMARSTHGVAATVLAMTRLSQIGPIGKVEAPHWLDVVPGPLHGNKLRAARFGGFKHRARIGLWVVVRLAVLRFTCTSHDG